MKMKQGINEKKSTGRRMSRKAFGLALAVGILVTCYTGRAQNDAAEAVSNAVVEAAASIVSNAIVQISESASTNEVVSNDVAQAEGTATDTNFIGVTNFSASPQLGPLESRRQWLLRQRAGTPATNDSGNPNERIETNNPSDSMYRPVKPEFSVFKLITDNDIFDPNRVRHRPGEQSIAKKIAESFALVGIMSYEKGTFAFFSGNSSEYTKAVKLNDTIAGYKVIRIEPNSVHLLNGTNQVELQVGMQLSREEAGGWVPSAQSEIYAANTSASAATHSDSGSGGADNDVLERLRKKREQE